MPYWWWSSWLWEFLGLVLIGAGFVVAAIVLTNRSQHGRSPTSPLVTGDTTLPVQINFSSIRIGGDLAGLLVVIGVVVALLPLLWGFYVVVAVGAVLVAIALFTWHRRR